MFNKYKLYKSDVFTVKILPCSFINSQHFSVSYIKKNFSMKKGHVSLYWIIFIQIRTYNAYLIIVIILILIININDIGLNHRGKRIKIHIIPFIEICKIGIDRH